MRLESPLNRDAARPPVDLNFGALPRYPKPNVGLPDRDTVMDWARLRT